jgi:maleylpyruvate isomerase
VTVDLEKDPDRAAELCRDAYQRLTEPLSRLTDEDVTRPSRLPDWSVAHVLTHLARNADAHARRLQGALAAQNVPKYPGGSEQRTREIEEGARRPAAEIVADLEASQARLDDLFTQAAAAGWPNPQGPDDDSYGPRGAAAHRLREIEMHHVDLGLGYTPQSWSDDYVAWDLDVVLRTVPDRLADPQQRRDLVAWLAGRGPMPSGLTLAPWG